MLSPHDREELAKIESLLETTDPAFATTMRAPKPRRWGLVLLVLVDVLAGLMLVLAFAAGAPNIVLWAVIILAVALCAHLIRLRRRR
jgi:hypothetical protein